MNDETEKKIIIDEDWKSRVTAEKEAAQQAPTGEPAGDSASDETPQGQPAADAPPEFPPASFEMLMTALATEAMMGMGLIPHPVTGEPQTNFSQARYAIDMLEVLQAKTKGNLETGEENALRDILHQLRMSFVAVQAKPQAADAPSP